MHNSMKTKVSLIILLCCFFLTGCLNFHKTISASITTKQKKEIVIVPHNILKDFDVSRAPKSFSVNDGSINWFYYEDVSNRKLLYEDTVFSSNLATYVYRTPEDASIYSPTIVIGEIVDIYYTDTLDVFPPAATILDIKISTSLRGDLIEDDIISVIEYGGYIRAEYDKTAKPEYIGTSELIKVQRRANTPEPNIGDNYVLFLRPCHLINGAYFITGEWMGKYILTNDGTVSRFISENNYWTFGTLEELINVVINSPFDEVQYNNRFPNF